MSKELREAATLVRKNVVAGRYAMKINSYRFYIAIFPIVLLFPGVSLAQSAVKLAWITLLRSGSGQEKGSDGSQNLAPQEAEWQRGGPAEYVGAETCRGCHEDLGQGFDQGPHGKTAIVKREGPEWQGCEACHGPGREHAQSGDPSNILRFPSLSREASSRRCLGCHASSEEHANFMRSPHMKNNVGCVDCHAVHHPAVERKILRAAQPQLCYSCHSDVKSNSAKPFHHPASDGVVTCTNCHNPHGAAPRQKDNRDQTPK
jgi:predicted CXXCH cytochrome family protein